MTFFYIFSLVNLLAPLYKESLYVHIYEKTKNKKQKKQKKKEKSVLKNNS